MHAILITAYTDFPALCKLVDAIDKERFIVHIHIDKKSKYTLDEERGLIEKGCLIYRKYTVPWGGLNHLLAILFLMEEALKNKVINYIHIISGQDYPLMNAEKMYSECDGSIFMGIKRHQTFSKSEKHRYERYNLFHFLQNSFIYNYVDLISLYLQKKLRIKRPWKGPFNELGKGMVWTSMPFEVAQYILNHPSKMDFIKSLKNVYIPEEFFFQTIIINSHYINRIKSHRRFTDWQIRNGSSPAFLDKSDFNRIINSNAFFIRKVSSVISFPLINQLNSRFR